MRIYPSFRGSRIATPSKRSSATGVTVGQPGRHSRLYKLGMIYLGASILFEFLDQLLFFRLLGFDEITDVMLIARLSVDLLFVMAGFYHGIGAQVFRGSAISLLAVLTVYGLAVGIIRQNLFIEMEKDFVLFALFIFKFAIFKAIFTAGDNLDDFYKKLQKYCRYTLYVGAGSLAIMLALTRLGFSFYEQGISNLDWYVSYAVATNRPMAALLGLSISFLLAKRMVLLSCAVIFFPWFFMRLLRGSPMIFMALTTTTIIVGIFLQFISFDSESLNYAVRIDLYQLGAELQNFSMDTIRQILIILDNPRYLESWSALHELQDAGFWFGGGFGFEYLDVYTYEIVSNAHFSPVGLITKVGFPGMILFYYVFFRGTVVGLRAREPMTKLCGYYVLGAIVGSLLTWKFFLSSPLLPMALAAALHCQDSRARLAPRK